MDISRVKFQSLRPMLRTKDLQATIDFYTRRLGFTCDGVETLPPARLIADLKLTAKLVDNPLERQSRDVNVSVV